ncbi:MAG: HEAT repeat domain-containing protein [Chthoniobacterales bacterium]
MEILGPDILRIATNLSVLLSGLSLLLLGVIVVIRLKAESRATHRSRYRHRVEPLVAGFVAGRKGVEQVTPQLTKDPDEALALLMEVSEHLRPSDRPRLHALFAVLPMRTDLRADLQGRKWENRLAAAERLGYLGDHGTVDELITALQDEVLVVRFAAARSLVALRSAAAVEPILAAFDVPGELNERRTAEILYEMGEDANEPLLAVVHDAGSGRSESVLNVASRVLGMLRCRAAVAPLTALLKHSEFRVRLNAARALGNIGDRSVLPSLTKLTEDPSWEVRNAAVQAIGKLRGTDEIGNLVATLADSAWWVRFSSAQALFALVLPGLDALKEAARGATDRYARDMCIQVLEEHGIFNQGASS